MTKALLTEPEVADRVSLAYLLRWHLERRGARFIKLGRTYGYLVVLPTMGNGAAGLQRVPVPIVMWNPVKTHRSVPLRLCGPAMLEVAGAVGRERAAVTAWARLFPLSKLLALNL
jgi:hypothetical protein